MARRAASLAGRAPRSVRGRTARLSGVPGRAAAACRDSASRPTISPPSTRLVGEYLFEELRRRAAGFVTSAGARALLRPFPPRARRRPGAGRAREFADDLRALERRPGRPAPARAAPGWRPSGVAAGAGRSAEAGAEAVAIELCRTRDRPARLVGRAGRDGRRPARRAPAHHRRPADAAARRVAGRAPGSSASRAGARLPGVPAAAHRAGRGRTRAAAARRVPAQGDERVRPQPAARRGLPAADRRQPGQAARRGRRRQAHRPDGPAAADLAARLRQDHADGVRRQPAGPGLREGRTARRSATR